MAGSTTNYGFRKPTSSDLVNVALDISDNMEDIDSTIAVVAAAAAAAASDASDAATDAAAAAADAADAAADVAIVGGNLTTHEADTTNIHGIADTAALATTAALTAHAVDTTAIHGIVDTALLLTPTPTPRRVTLIDDFWAQNTANGDVGQLGWRCGGLGTNGVDPGIASHPGITVLSSGTTANNDRWIHMGDGTNAPVVATDVEYLIGVIRINLNTSVRIRFGLVQDGETPPGTAGAFFQFDSGVHANWQVITRNSGTSTTTTSPTALAAATWYQLEATRNSGTGNWAFTINGVSAGTAHSTNLPTAVVTPVFWVQCLTTTNKDLECDYFGLTTKEMAARY